MPTYEYKCSNCNHEFEILQSIKDDALTLCTKCGHNTLKKLVSMPGGLIFKGTGFYQTDYKNISHTTASSEVSLSKSTKPDESKPSESKEPVKDAKSDSQKLSSVKALRSNSEKNFIGKKTDSQKPVSPSRNSSFERAKAVSQNSQRRSKKK